MRQRPLTRVLQVFAVESTRGVSAITGMLSCLVALAIASIADTTTMPAGWASPLNLSLTACLYLAPVAAGLAAMRSSSLTQSGVLEVADASASGRSSALGLAFVALAGWQLLAYTTLTATLLLSSNLGGPWAAEMLLLPTQAVALLLFAAGLGFATGQRSASFVTGPILALILFVTLYGLDLAYDGLLGRLSPLYADIVYGVNRVPNVRLLAGLSLGLLGMTAVSVALWRHASRAKLTIALGGVLCMLAGGVSVASAGPGELQNRQANSPGKCQTAQGTELCVWPEIEPQLTQSLGALNAARDAAAPLFEVPSSFFQAGLRPRTPDAREYRVPNIGEGSFFIFAIEAVLPPSVCRQSSEGEELFALIYERAVPGSVEQGSVVARTARLTAAQQRAWAAPRLNALRQCR